MPTLAEDVIDNIALEGLEGLTLSTLWLHLSRVTQMALPLHERVQEEVWKFIKLKHVGNFSFYVLPVKRPPYKILNRLTCIDSDLGIPISEKNDYPDRFKVCPINERNVKGSCEFYNERKLIPFAELKDMTAKEVDERWGEKFVIVGSQELRCNALSPQNVKGPMDISSIQYVVLEAIGRARQAGETTNGPYSLLHFCKDAHEVFYIKTRLLQSGLITVAAFHELRKNRITASTILTLPRFHKAYKSHLITVIEKLFVVLKASADHRLPLKDAVAEINKTGTVLTSFKKISSTHHFRRIFETQMMPRKSKEPTEKPKAENAKVPMIKMVWLRDPTLTLDNLFEEDTGSKEESHGEFYSCKHACVGMPPRDEVYRVIHHYGTRGLSQAEICDYLGMHPVTIRHIVKHMLLEGMIKTYSLDRGRQRITMHVALEHYGIVKKERDKTLQILDSLQGPSEPNIADLDDIKLPDIPEIKALLKPINFGMEISARSLTQRQVARRTTIVRTVNERCLVQFGEIRSIIQRLEKEQGFADEVCQKSVRRLLASLRQCNAVGTYSIQLDYNEYTRLYNYATHPKIDMEHAVMQREILKLKNSLFMAIEDRRLKADAQLKSQLKKLQLQTGKKEGADKLLAPAEETAATANILRLNTTRNAPKFLLSRFLHEFLFYLVVELNEQADPQVIDESLLHTWQQTEPSLNIAEYLAELKTEEVKAYRAHISWRTFIKPLPPYSDKPAGWVLFNDAIDRLPLSLFNKIFRLETKSDDHLCQYLEHPIRQHYMLSQLSFDIRCRINQLQMQRYYMAILRLMNNMGLVQVSDRIKKKGAFWLYLNRRLQILDTTTTESGYAKIQPDRQYDSIHFELKDFESLQSYWTTLQRVCLYTRLGFRDKCIEKLHVKELAFLSSVSFDEAPAHDTGELVGDRRGAGGLSANLYAHLFRKWAWVKYTQTKLKPKRRCTKSYRSNGSAATTLLRKGHTALVRALSGNGRVVRRAANTKAAGQPVARKRRPPIRDSIDREALRNMRTLRVSWRKEEDAILKMARAVFNFMGSPLLSVFGLLVVGKVCRDVMRHTLGSTNKTCQACVRRMHFIVKMNRHVPEVPTWMHTLQTSTQMQRLYGEDFLSRLKAIYPNRQEYGDALTKHFCNILLYLYRQVCQNGQAHQVPSFIIPDTLAELNKLYTTHANLADDQLLMYTNPSSLTDVQVAIVLNVLHSTLCSAMDKTHYHLQAFEIYKHYSEDVLQRAFVKARGDALVVAIKRRNMQLIPSQLAGPAFLLSSKYRTRLIFLKIPYAMYDSYFAYMNQCLRTLFRADGTSVGPELKSPQLGQLLFVAESLSRHLLDIHIKLPINILTVDAEKRQTMSPLDRILDHYHCMFDNAPQTEYIKNFESDSSERQVRVKFHPANLSYKLSYTPYDQISKLPMRCLHFFCALDHLGQEVAINFNKLLRKDTVDGSELLVGQCPFKCILGGGNYLTEIERIVHEKRHELVNLSEMAPQKLLNQALSDCSVRVESTNLLTLVRMLESFWHEKESAYEIKDFGKISGNLKANKPVDWPEMCLEILNYNLCEEDNDKNDEYEPTLNKEERIRAQDVFVVNLPTISLEVGSGIAHAEGNATCAYNHLQVPTVWVGDIAEHARILDKILDEAIWKYSDTTFSAVAKQLDDQQFGEQEKAELKRVHDVIQAHKLGMPVADLLLEFADRALLQRSLRFLCAQRLIKRVGVASFMYVHKDNIREWIVHTFHIKRLERENLGLSATSSSKKRLHEPATIVKGAEESDEVPNKIAKCEDGEPVKRKVKEPKRLQDAPDENKTPPPEIFKETMEIKPQPWIRLIGTLNRRVLDRWLGSILSECIARSGCIVHEIFLRFPHMQPVDIMFLLEVLTDLKCIHLTEIRSAKQSLLTEYEELQEEIVTDLYDPESTYVTAQPDAVMRLTLFIGQKKYHREFI